MFTTLHNITRTCKYHVYPLAISPKNVKAKFMIKQKSSFLSRFVDLTSTQNSTKEINRTDRWLKAIGMSLLWYYLLLEQIEV